MPVILFGGILRECFNSETDQNDGDDEHLDCSWRKEVRSIVEVVEICGLIFEILSKSINERLKTRNWLIRYQSYIMKAETWKDV